MKEESLLIDLLLFIRIANYQTKCTISKFLLICRRNFKVQVISNIFSQNYVIVIAVTVDVVVGNVVAAHAAFAFTQALDA